MRNPILPGCHPDPSICRAGDAYYIVTSSFTYFPGLPIFRSTDLATWTPIGHVLDDPGDVDLDGLPTSHGVWAPTIRFHAGVFYVVYTVTRALDAMETYVSTTTDPAGAWSRPTRIEAEGFDPSLFFDDDGRAWLTACVDADDRSVFPGEIWMREFDAERLATVGPRYPLWRGAVAGAWIEAPHLYRRGDRYHLIAAEGGTESHHAVTAATAESVTGPYTTDPRSPLLTHRHLGSSSAIQNVGHADLVDGPDGSSWAVVLGVRKPLGFHTTGRETFLVPVTWEPDGPVFAPGRGQVDLELAPPAGRASSPPPPPRPGLEWVGLRGRVAASIGADGHEVSLTPGLGSLALLGTPAFLGVRQTEAVFRFETSFDVPDAPVAAGIVAFQNERRFVRLELRATPSAVVAEVAEQYDDELRSLATVQFADRAVRAFVESDGRLLRFGLDGVVLAEVAARDLSTESAGGFVGTLLGVSAVGPPMSPRVVFGSIAMSSQPIAAALIANG